MSHSLGCAVPRRARSPGNGDAVQPQSPWIAVALVVLVAAAVGSWCFRGFASPRRRCTPPRPMRSLDRSSPRELRQRPNAARRRDSEDPQLPSIPPGGLSDVCCMRSSACGPRGQPSPAIGPSVPDTSWAKARSPSDATRQPVRHRPVRSVGPDHGAAPTSPLLDVTYRGEPDRKHQEHPDHHLRQPRRRSQAAAPGADQARVTLRTRWRPTSAVE